MIGGCWVYLYLLPKLQQSAGSIREGRSQNRMSSLSERVSKFCAYVQLNPDLDSSLSRDMLPANGNKNFGLGFYMHIAYIQYNPYIHTCAGVGISIYLHIWSDMLFVQTLELRRSMWWIGDVVDNRSGVEHAVISPTLSWWCIGLRRCTSEPTPKVGASIPRGIFFTIIHFWGRFLVTFTQHTTINCI